MAGLQSKKTLGSFIFLSRWLQAPLYLGLIVAQTVYVYRFILELGHLIGFALFGHAQPASVPKEVTDPEMVVMLSVLGLIDVVMIANLLIMVIVGGYETFVSRLNLQNHPDQPEWLSHVNASVLKVKLAMAIIGISSIHLLKTFIAAGSIGGLPMCTPEQIVALSEAVERGAVVCATLTSTGVMWQTIIHTIFILSALGIAWTDRVMNP